MDSIRLVKVVCRALLVGMLIASVSAAEDYRMGIKGLFYEYSVAESAQYPQGYMAVVDSSRRSPFGLTDMWYCTPELGGPYDGPLWHVFRLADDPSDFLSFALPLMRKDTINYSTWGNSTPDNIALLSETRGTVASSLQHDLTLLRADEALQSVVTLENGGLIFQSPRFCLPIATFEMMGFYPRAWVDPRKVGHQYMAPGLQVHHVKGSAVMHDPGLIRMRLTSPANPGPWPTLTEGRLSLSWTSPAGVYPMVSQTAVLSFSGDTYYTVSRLVQFINENKNALYPSFFYTESKRFEQSGEGWRATTVSGTLTGITIRHKVTS